MVLLEFKIFAEVEVRAMHFCQIKFGENPHIKFNISKYYRLSSFILWMGLTKLRRYPRVRKYSSYIINCKSVLFSIKSKFLCNWPFFFINFYSTLQVLFLMNRKKCQTPVGIRENFTTPPAPSKKKRNCIVAQNTYIHT